MPSSSLELSRNTGKRQELKEFLDINIIISVNVQMREQSVAGQPRTDSVELISRLASVKRSHHQLDYGSQLGEHLLTT